jgi:uncharacterized protein
VAGSGAAPIRRRPRRVALAVVLAGAVLFAVAPIAIAQPAVPPAPTRWVTDDAGFLSPGVREELDGRLHDYQVGTGHQVVVWIGASTGGVPTEDFAVRAFAAWKVGRKGLDDGLAIFLFALDRKVRFEVGYGLEGRVPDAIASRIIGEVIEPRLKAGDHDGAVTHGVDATMAVVDGQPWSTIEAQAATGTDLGAAPETPENRAGAGPTVQHGLLRHIFIGILIAAVLLFLVTHPSVALELMFDVLVDGVIGGRGGGGFSGGGGSSGGGGASGSW